MAKKKSRQGNKDLHTSGFMVRLPEQYREALRALKEKTDRPISVSVRRAVDAYLIQNGMEPPKTD